jgi:hypothetical protein
VGELEYILPTTEKEVANKESKDISTPSWNTRSMDLTFAIAGLGYCDRKE